MGTLALVAALGIALLASLWRWEAEKERREQAEKDLTRWRREVRDSEQERVRLRAVEEAAYAMYSVLCRTGNLSDDEPAVAQYRRAAETLWQAELEDVKR